MCRSSKSWKNATRTSWMLLKRWRMGRMASAKQAKNRFHSIDSRPIPPRAGASRTPCRLEESGFRCQEGLLFTVLTGTYHLEPVTYSNGGKTKNSFGIRARVWRAADAAEGDRRLGGVRHRQRSACIYHRRPSRQIRGGGQRPHRRGDKEYGRRGGLRVAEKEQQENRALARARGVEKRR